MTAAQPPASSLPDEGAPTEQPDEVAPKPQRPALVVFTGATLMLESLATFFATLVTWGLGRAEVIEVSPGLVWVGGFTLAALFALASSRAKLRSGRVLGWVLHAPLIAAGLLVPAIAFVGVMFLAVYALGVRWGARIDRERAERAAEGVTS